MSIDVESPEGICGGISKGNHSGGAETVKISTQFAENLKIFPVQGTENVENFQLTNHSENASETGENVQVFWLKVVENTPMSENVD